MSAVPSAVPVGREERRALLAAAAGCFCLLCGYYMLRPMREALALEVGVQQQLDPVQRGARRSRAALLPIYWWLVGRTPRGRAAVDRVHAVRCGVPRAGARAALACRATGRWHSSTSSR